MSNTVSIVIPSYNRALLIAETLDCLKAQTHSEWECIIIDDTSSDNTEEVVKRYCDSDKRFQYFRNAVNLGRAGSINEGIKKATGDFFFFLDSDDLIGKDKLRLQVDFLAENKDVDICYTGARYFYDNAPAKLLLFGVDNFLIQVELTKYDTDVKRCSFIRNPYVTSAPLFRAEIFKTVGFFDETLRLYEDWDFNIRCAKQGLRIQYIGYTPDNGTFIRIHGSSLLRVNSGTNKYYKRIMDKHPEIINNSIVNTSRSKVVVFFKLLMPPFVFLICKRIYAKIFGRI